MFLGADVNNHAGSDGETNLLYQAAYHGHLACVKYLLTVDNIDVNRGNQHLRTDETLDTPLCGAIFGDNADVMMDMVEALINAGADVDQVCHNGRSGNDRDEYVALHAAAARVFKKGRYGVFVDNESPYMKVCEFLRDAGAIDVPVLDTNCNGYDNAYMWVAGRQVNYSQLKAILSKLMMNITVMPDDKADDSCKPVCAAGTPPLLALGYHGERQENPVNSGLMFGRRAPQVEPGDQSDGAFCNTVLGS